MDLPFPDDFMWGTSSAFACIETASDHTFSGLKARDGHLLTRTTDHEKRRLQDVDHIARFGSIYRCSVDWARLQAKAFDSFNKVAVAEYREFFAALNHRGVRIVFVLHHFAHPEWFERDGGWKWESNQEVFYDYATRCMDAFGDLVYSWNTLNEPNIFALNAYYQGLWPPYAKSLTQASRVLGNMAQAHEHLYRRLKDRFPAAPVGYCLHTVFAEGRGFRAQATARLFDWWFYSRPIQLFTPTDYVGLSYTAYVVFDPDPLMVSTDATRLEQLGIEHDRLWPLKPDGLAYNISRVHKDTGKPIWVFDNGVCTDDPERRIAITKRYLAAVHSAIRERVPVMGYAHKTAWDSFEWHFGPTYRYGLLHVDLGTMDRENTAAADWYEHLVASSTVEL